MKSLKKVKTTIPLYWYYKSECVGTDSPEDICGIALRCGRDYDYLRVGSIMSVYNAREYYDRYLIFERENISEDAVVCVADKKGLYIFFENLDAIDCEGWFVEVNE